MLDMGWTEILVIGVVALIVVGPKDLPRMMRTVGQQVGKLRAMAREFQRTMEDAAREADLEEFKGIKDTLNDVRSVQRDAAGAIRRGFSEIEKDVDKSVDLKTEDIYEEAPKSETAKVEEEPVRRAPSDPPLVTPEASVSDSTTPGPDADETATADDAPEPRRASGA